MKSAEDIRNAILAGITAVKNHEVRLEDDEDFRSAGLDSLDRMSVLWRSRPGSGLTSGTSIRAISRTSRPTSITSRRRGRTPPEDCLGVSPRARLCRAQGLPGQPRQKSRPGT